MTIGCKYDSRAPPQRGETGIWLEIIRRSGMMTMQNPGAIIGECDELSRIIGAGIRTVSRKGPQNSLVWA